MGQRLLPRHEQQSTAVGGRADGAVSADARDLAGFGYKAKLDRTLGSFSAFAAGFSYLSILTGIFQMFHVGFQAGGPAFFWTWPVVFLGQFLVALCFAELAAHYPLAGGVYQWSKHVGSGAIGWMAGWVYLASLIISISAVALALQVTLPQIAGWFQIIGDQANETHRALNAVLLGCVLITFTTLLNSIGVKFLARINNLGVLAEMFGAGLLIVLLAAQARRSPGIVFDTQGLPSGFGYAGPFLAAALVACYVMYGFDTAGSLAEETAAPRRRAPPAILQALAAAAGAGALLLLFALMAAEDFTQLADPSHGLPSLVKDRLGERLGTAFLCDVVFAITVCALAVHTTTVRVTFAMARDNNLPFGSALARVWETSRTPVIPAVAAGLLAAMILVVNVSIRGLIDLIAPVAILWANLAYLLVTLPLLYRRLKGWPRQGHGRGAGATPSPPSPHSCPPPRAGEGRQGGSTGFTLGKWGVPVNALAVAWGMLMIVNIGWPRPQGSGTAWYARYGALLFTAALLASGGLYYGLVQRHKTGVLPDHRA